MLFGNYLNIWKLVFIWINLDLKPVPKKTNFKLVLFHSNFFSFYFISSHYYFSLFIPINYFSIDLDNRPSPSSTTIRHSRRPPPSYPIVCRWLPPTTMATVDCHRRPALTTIDDHTIYNCLSLFAIAAHLVLHCLLSLAIIFYRSHCLSTMAATPPL